MITKFKEIPDHLIPFTNEELSEETFADDVNMIFAINDEESITQAIAFLKDNPYKDYSRAERLYILDRICRAAKEFDVNLDDLLESLGGETMSVDKNSPEFQEALAKELKIQTDKLMSDLADKNKHAKALDELNSQLNGNKESIEAKDKEIETLKAEKEKVEQAFDEYKKDVETKAKIRERIDELKAAGLEEEDWTETEEAVAEMSDKVFALYKGQVAETVKAAGNPFEKMSPEDKKKKEEEDKKKKKAKASTDIVKESQEEGTLPNSEDKEKDSLEFKMLEKVLARRRGEKEEE
jgi:hypothetical protein